MILKTFPEVTGQVGRCGEGMDKDLKKNNQGHGQKVILSMNGPSVDGGTNKVCIQKLASSHLGKKGAVVTRAPQAPGAGLAPRSGVEVRLSARNQGSLTWPRPHCHLYLLPTGL